MSVLVDGMKMPSCCNECRCLDDHYDYPLCLLTEETRGYNFNVSGSKMPKCPLRETCGKWITDHFPNANDPVVVLLKNGDMAFAKYDAEQSAWKTNDANAMGEYVYAWTMPPTPPEDFIPTLPDGYIQNLRAEIDGEWVHVAN